MSTTTNSPTGQDRTRQVVVTLAEVFCVVGTLVGVGVLGTRVQESSGGALAADATLLAPAGPAFSIWSVIYLGLAGYTIWQWFPTQTTDLRHRAIGYWAATSMVLNALWLLVTQQGWIWVSVVVIIVLAVCLGQLIQRLSQLRRAEAPSVTEKLLLDGTFGLYLGWVAVATCANVAAAGVASGLDPAPGVAAVIASVVLAVAAGLGVVFARRFGGRWAVAAAMSWGLGWIAVGRLTDQPRSALVGVSAIAAAAVVLLAAAREHRTSVDLLESVALPGEAD